jgi:hypothetical protein
MITLLERGALLTTGQRASRDWSRQAQVPSIVRDGAPYDPHLDRFFADMLLNGAPSTACAATLTICSSGRAVARDARPRRQDALRRRDERLLLRPDVLAEPSGLAAVTERVIECFHNFPSSINDLNGLMP